VNLNGVLTSDTNGKRIF